MSMTMRKALLRTLCGATRLVDVVGAPLEIRVVISSPEPSERTGVADASWDLSGRTTRRFLKTETSIGVPGPTGYDFVAMVYEEVRE